MSRASGFPPPSKAHLNRCPFPPCTPPGNGTNTCLCLNVTMCEVFRKGYLMLYPFSTEYCLICCAVLFVMWKNVGRRLAPAAGTPPCTPSFHLHGAIFGPLLGLLVLVAGVCVFVLFQIQASGPAIAREYFTIYYAFYVAALPAMSLACLAGTAIHGLEERELDTFKNPTRSLDVVLLMGAALGQMGISYFSIVAIVATRPHELLNCLILAYSLLLILQHMAQNLFIIEGLHRRPLWEVAPESLAGKWEAEPPRRGSLLELGQDLRRASLAYIHSYSHLNWKRRALKEISLFLILCNITVSSGARRRGGGGGECRLELVRRPQRASYGKEWIKVHSLHIESPERLACPLIAKDTGLFPTSSMLLESVPQLPARYLVWMKVTSL